ncbi:sulfite exporter TauE/SafE family protein [Bacillaceae bacterium]
MMDIIDLEFGLLLFSIGLVGSFFSGMLGIGGAIVIYPLLLFGPKVLGIAELTPYQVTSITILQVFFSSLIGTLTYRKEKAIDTKLALVMGTSVTAGSFTGGFVSFYLGNETINLLYAILATVGVVLMLVPIRPKDGPKGVRELFDSAGSVAERNVHYSLSAMYAGVIGLASGIVGAGGAFILIPVMTTLLRIPIRTTIATSLAIVFLSSIGGLAGKLTTGQIPWGEALWAVAGSLPGVRIGVQAGRLLHGKYLQLMLAGLILTVVVRMWMQVF